MPSKASGANLTVATEAIVWIGTLGSAVLTLIEAWLVAWSDGDLAGLRPASGKLPGIGIARRPSLSHVCASIDASVGQGATLLSGHGATSLSVRPQLASRGSRIKRVGCAIDLGCPDRIFSI